MRKFNRGEEPKGLAKARHDKVSWEELSQDKRGRQVKDSIRNVLLDAQRGLCAYCETALLTKHGDFNGHIEHLDRRNDTPEKSCDWNNIFLSCSHSDSCGKFKDNPKNKIKFRVEDVVDPAREDPQDFFEYSEPDGSILPRKDSSEIEKRAKETIRVFNLANSLRLQRMRKQIVSIVRNFKNVCPNASEQEILVFLSLYKDAEMFSVYCSLMKVDVRLFD